MSARLRRVRGSRWREIKERWFGASRHRSSQGNQPLTSPPLIDSASHEEIDWTLALRGPPLSLSGATESIGGDHMRSMSYGEGFSELATYREGDPVHRLHWQSLFCRGELVSRRYELSRSAALCIFIDETGSMYTGAYWRASRQLSAHLATRATRAGHRVRFIIDREGDLIESPWLTRTEELMWWWGRLFSAPPSGEGAPISRRSQRLSDLASSSYLVCISDGVCTAHSHSEERGATSSLIDVSDQLSGALGRLRRVFYLCLIDDEAESAPLGVTLRSSETALSLAAQTAPLKAPERAEALKSLALHRAAQRATLQSMRGVSWEERSPRSSLSELIELITQRLS